MDRVFNPSVARLNEILLRQMKERDYAQYTTDQVNRFAQQISDFMAKNDMQVYSEEAGSKFLVDFIQHHMGRSHINEAKIFVARLDAALRGEEYVTCRKLSVPEILPAALEDLLSRYATHCVEKGLCAYSVEKYGRICRRFLKAMTDDGVYDHQGINVETVSRACLRTNVFSLPAIHAFLRFLSDANILDRDYSLIIPRFKHPEPMPSVYSPEEIRSIEAVVDRGTLPGKRDYPMLLLATRLGIRACDIVALTWDNLDFESGHIRFHQQKTGEAQELPMLPDIREALQDYIQNGRRVSDSPYVFLRMIPPYTHLSPLRLRNIVHDAIQKAEIDPGLRGQGGRAMRSSLATSMVNDDVPYEAVRRTLGHTNMNAIKSYARVDVEQLRLCALEPPAAVGNFAAFLSGRLDAK